MNEGKEKEKKMKIKVGIVQMISENGNLEGNFQKAEKMVKEAVENHKVKLIILPEFFAIGYELSDTLWTFAEPTNGKTTKFLLNLSKKHKILICGTYLELDQKTNQFYNTFVMTSPLGVISSIRKSEPASFEAFFFSTFNSKHSFKIPFSLLSTFQIGEYSNHDDDHDDDDNNNNNNNNNNNIKKDFIVIGVQICYENFLTKVSIEIRKEKVNLILMPFSAPIPTPQPLFPSHLIEKYLFILRSIGKIQSKIHKVPTLYCNKVGKWFSPIPLIGRSEDSKFPGGCSITNAEGNFLQLLDDENESLATDFISISLEEKDLKDNLNEEKIDHFIGGFIVDLANPLLLFRFAEFFGKIFYFLSIKRRKIAREILEKAKKDQNDQIDDPVPILFPDQFNQQLVEPFSLFTFRKLSLISILSLSSFFIYKNFKNL